MYSTSLRIGLGSKGSQRLDENEINASGLGETRVPKKRDATFRGEGGTRP